MESFSPEYVGHLFEERRKELGLIRYKVANIIGVSASKLMQHENGEGLLKNSEVVKNLCHLLYDDGELMAMWLIAYNRLEFPTKLMLDEALVKTKQCCKFILTGVCQTTESVNESENETTNAGASDEKSNS